MTNTFKISNTGNWKETAKGPVKGELLRVDAVSDGKDAVEAKPVYLAVKVVEISRGDNREPLQKAFLSSATEIVGSLDGEQTAVALFSQFSKSVFSAGIALDEFAMQPMPVGEGHPFRSALVEYYEDYKIA